MNGNMNMNVWSFLKSKLSASMRSYAEAHKKTIIICAAVLLGLLLLAGSSIFSALSQGKPAGFEQVLADSRNGIMFSEDGSVLLRYPEQLPASRYEVPACVNQIWPETFANCKNLSAIVLPDNIEDIGSSAFRGCSSLYSIVIPCGVTSIEDGTFFNCKLLSSVTIPDSVTSIGDSAFKDCDNLVIIGEKTFFTPEIPNSITVPDSVISIGKEAFADCANLTGVTIPDSVTSIGDRAFSDCGKLTGITIPNSVTSMGNDVFYSCSNVTVKISKQTYDRLGGRRTFGEVKTDLTD